MRSVNIEILLLMVYIRYLDSIRMVCRYKILCYEIIFSWFVCTCMLCQRWDWLQKGLQEISMQAMKFQRPILSIQITLAPLASSISLPASYLYIERQKDGKNNIVLWKQGKHAFCVYSTLKLRYLLHTIKMNHHLHQVQFKRIHVLLTKKKHTIKYIVC